MNSNKVMAALALASGASASIMSCATKANIKYFMQAGSLGLQSDTTDQTTDCNIEVTNLSGYVDDIIDSFEVLDSTNWTDPIQNIQSFGIQATNVFAACDSNAYAQQLTTRTTTLGGFFELIVTIATPLSRQFYFNDASAADEDLYNWWKIMTQDNGEATSQAECEGSATAFGQIYSMLMNAQTPDAVYYGEIQQDWSSDF